MLNDRGTGSDRPRSPVTGYEETSRRHPDIIRVLTLCNPVTNGLQHDSLHVGFTMQVGSPVTDCRDTRVEIGALSDPTLLS